MVEKSQKMKNLKNSNFKKFKKLENSNFKKFEKLENSSIKSAKSQKCKKLE